MIVGIDIPIYNTDCLALIDPTKEEFNEILSSEKNQDRFTKDEIMKVFDEIATPNYAGFVGTLDKGGYVMIIKDSKDPVCWSHEIFHLAHCILYDRDVELTEKGEAYAYLIGFLTKQYFNIDRDDNERNNQGTRKDA